jgi:hypothetical protein
MIPRRLAALLGVSVAVPILACAGCSADSSDTSDAGPPPAPATTSPPPPAPPPPSCYGTFLLVSADNGKGLDDNAGSRSDGSLIDTWGLPVAPFANWAWLLRPASGGTFSILSAASGKCLDDEGGTENGASVSQAACSGGAPQQWSFEQFADGTAAIVNADNTRCLDDDGARTDGISAVTWDCSRWTTQRWHVEKLGVSSFPAARYVVTSGLSGKALEVDASDATADATVDTWSAATAAGTGFDWVLRPLKNGSFELVNVSTGQCLDDAGAVTGGTTVKQQACSGGSSQQWNVVQTPQGTFTIQSAGSGQCLDNGGGTENGVPVVTGSCSNGTAQRWWIDAVVRPAGGGAQQAAPYDPCGPTDLMPAQ